MSNIIELTLVCAAQALAINVFPVPGGPYKSTPKYNNTQCTATDKHMVHTHKNEQKNLNTFRWFNAQIFKSIFVC